MLVQKFIPFGICAGSEHQGGKHELSYMPVQAAVNHVTTMTIDGQSRDLVNYWPRIGLRPLPSLPKVIFICPDKFSELDSWLRWH